MLSPALLILAGLAFAALATRGLSQVEIRYALLAYVFHVISSFGAWATQEYYYGITDAHVYMQAGDMLARLLEHDFIRFAPEIVRLWLHVEPAGLPFPIWGAGTSSGTMQASAAVFVYLFGPSLLAACLASTIVSWFGQLCLYRVVRQEIGVDERRLAMLGCLFAPSAVFWGAAFAKEALMMGAFGILCWGTHRTLKHRSVPGLVLALGGGTGVAMLKAYVLIPFVVAVAAWLYAEKTWRSGGRAIRPLYLVLAGSLAIGGVVGVGTVFPEFSQDSVAETIARQQGLWEQTEGGSTIEMGHKDARTFGQQLPYVPIALVNSLFRPFVFEARNATSAAAGLETLLLTIAVVWLLLRFPFKSIRATGMRSPLLVFCFVFVIFFSIAVGLATSNLGSLSRYRVPMMPFYAMAVLLLIRRVPAGRPSDAPAEPLPVLQ